MGSGSSSNTRPASWLVWSVNASNSHSNCMRMQCACVCVCGGGGQRLILIRFKAPRGWVAAGARRAQGRGVLLQDPHQSSSFINTTGPGNRKTRPQSTAEHRPMALTHGPTAGSSPRQPATAGSGLKQPAAAGSGRKTQQTAPDHSKPQQTAADCRDPLLTH